MNAPSLSRREFLASGGALVVSFAIAPRALAQAGEGASRSAGAKLPGSLDKFPMLDSWIRIDADGRITVFTGKGELGQGVRTALQQIAAEELAVPFAAVTMVTADTERTPDEGYTSGSNSLKDSGTAILNAAGQVRELLVAEAARRFAVDAGELTVRDGAVVSRSGKRAGYGELVAGQALHVRADGAPHRRDPRQRTVMGKAIARVDIPAKVTGGVAYVHDLRLPGMLHARMVRPPQFGARLKSLDVSIGERMPGVVKVVRDGSFVAVVARQEFQAVRAMRALADRAAWDLATPLPAGDVFAKLQQLPSEDAVIHDRNGAALGAMPHEATFRRAYQMHGAIGPACAVARYANDKLEIWTHGQGVFPLRAAVAELVGLPKERVHCIHMEGSGCYGHNGADDAAGDAAVIARAMPGTPIRVQWMREEEHTWEPYGSAMVTRVRAALDNGRISAWEYDVWSTPHSTRPGKAGNLAAGTLVAASFKPPPPRPIPQPEGGGDRNAIPLYAIPTAKVTSRFIAEMPLRASALRALGAYMNVFSIESFMDDLAAEAKADPVEFRLRHLEDPRAKDVIAKAAERFGWARWQRGKDRGRGFAFARYKNLAAYCAVAMEVEVDRETGAVRVGRVACAVDSGDAVNPDGIRNQIEGGIVQSISWTLYEAVTWDARRITSRDWARYPIVRFPAVPESVAVDVIERPMQPFLGTGEAAQGPTAAAVANAIADAVGARVREIPLTPERVKAAIKA